MKVTSMSSKSFFSFEEKPSVALLSVIKPLIYLVEIRRGFGVLGLKNLQIMTSAAKLLMWSRRSANEPMR